MEAQTEMAWEFWGQCKASGNSPGFESETWVLYKGCFDGNVTLTAGE